MARYILNDSKRNKFKQGDASLDAKTDAGDSCERASGVVFSTGAGSAAAKARAASGSFESSSTTGAGASARAGGIVFSEAGADRRSERPSSGRARKDSD